MLEFEVQPERSIGNEQWEFILGMPFYQAVHNIKRQDRVIKGVHIWYSDKNPLSTDLVINLSSDGVRLIFDSKCQLLKLIEVYNMSKVKLKYCGVLFNSAHIQPTVDQIDNSFGATHPGVYHDDRQLFVLNFRGLTFEFHVESRYEYLDRHNILNFQPRYSHGMGSLRFPNGTPPVVSKMYIYSGNSLRETRSPTMPHNCYHGNIYLKSVEVVRNRNVTKALKFTLISEGTAPSKLSDARNMTCLKTIKFGDSCEDVVNALGSPSKVYYKEEDKMKIHSADAKRFTDDRVPDYFYNYVTLGTDILFDSATHTVKKFILHTNYPGHYDFNMYYRCNFKIPLEVQSKPDNSSTRLSPETLYVEAETKWQTIEEVISKVQPVVLNRSSSTNTTNPFGSTFCYGIQDIIFEIMQNHHIASVTLYQLNDTPS